MLLETAHFDSTAAPLGKSARGRITYQNDPGPLARVGEVRSFGVQQRQHKNFSAIIENVRRDP